MASMHAAPGLRCVPPEIPQYQSNCFLAGARWSRECTPSLQRCTQLPFYLDRLDRPGLMMWGLTAKRGKRKQEHGDTNSYKQIQAGQAAAFCAYLCIHVARFTAECGCIMHGPAEKSDCFIPAF